jgi:hypothetical protein
MLAPKARLEFQSQPALFGMMMDYDESYDANLLVVPGDPHLCVGHGDLVEVGDSNGGEEQLRSQSHSYPEAKAYSNRLTCMLDGKKRIALLAERGGCSFEAKARNAMAIDAALRARLRNQAPIISFVVVYDDVPNRSTLVRMSASSSTSDGGLSISLVFVSHDTGITLLEAAKDSINNEVGGLPIIIDATAPWGGYGYIYRTNLYGEDYTREFVLAALAGFFMCFMLLGCLLICAQAGIISTDGFVFNRHLADEILARRQSTGRNTGASRPTLLTEDQIMALPIVEFRSELGGAVNRTRTEKPESIPTTGGRKFWNKRDYSLLDHREGRDHFSRKFWNKRDYSLLDHREGRDHFSCDICLEDYTEGELLLELPCGHKYHTHCIRPWLTKRSTLCPHCRTDVIDADPCFSRDAHTSLLPPVQVEYGSIGRGNHLFPRYMREVDASESTASNVESDV